jgi:ABC-type glycerol-3-phosphate transport system substrate-binding protein
VDGGRDNDEMMTGSRQILLLLCAALALSACNKESASSTAGAPAARPRPKVPVPVKVGPTAAEQTAGMVLAASQGKSPAPVEIKFELAQKPKVGQPLDVNLALIAQIPANPATVQVSGTEGLAVAPGGQFDIAAEEAGEVYKHTVSVTPETDGVLLLSVYDSHHR